MTQNINKIITHKHKNVRMYIYYKLYNNALNVSEQTFSKWLQHLLLKEEI